MVKEEDREELRSSIVGFNEDDEDLMLWMTPLPSLQGEWGL